MLLFYVDECGDHSVNLDPTAATRVLKSGVSPYFTLSAVGIRDSSRRPLAEALFEIKERHFGATVRNAKWSDTEIKGRYLGRAARGAASGKPLRSPGGYAKLVTPNQVSALVRDLGLIFDKYRPMTFSVVVDKNRLIRRREDVHPLGAAYAYLHQRVALTIEKLHAGESAILIADQQTQHETFFRSGAMNASRDQLSEALPVRPNFDLIVDKPLWVDTELSSWDREIIQLADIVAYASTECVAKGVAPELESYLWPHIAKTMAIHWRTGLIDGAGFAIFPKPRAFPLTR